MIASKYFESIDDFINLEIAVKRFNGNMERFHFNPIPLNDNTRKYFPNLETLHLYNEKDQVVKGGKIFRHCIWFKVDYETYLTEREKGSDCKMICYCPLDRMKYGNEIPNGVKIIGCECFKNCKTITSIQIPNSVVKLGHYCFNNCKLLTSITIPNSVTKLNEGCFSYCKLLKSVILSNSLIEMDDYCFRNCISLKRIEIPTTVTEIGKDCFFKCNFNDDN